MRMADSDSPTCFATLTLLNHPAGTTKDLLETSSSQGLHGDAQSTSGSATLSSDQEENPFDCSSGRSSSRTSQGSCSDEQPGRLKVSVSATARRLSETPSACQQETRSPFRTPSSVRAMQTETTPPRLHTPASMQHSRLYTPTRKSTPRSITSRTPSRMNQTHERKGPLPLQREYPLVLLHVNLLPSTLPTYTSETMAAVLPPTVVANWKLLVEKTSPMVFERGVLVAHPREDYDLLEERLLEALELKQPRILSCGHFRLSREEADDVDRLGRAEYIEDDLDVEPEEEGEDEVETCEDCGRKIRDGRAGEAGTGSKRWDIKIYAANGLMRSGAWTAAWREMERVDVEIRPWMEEAWKEQLEVRRIGEIGLGSRSGAGLNSGLDRERMREVYGAEASDREHQEGFEQHHGPEGEACLAPDQENERVARHRRSRKKLEDLTLGELVTRALILAMQDWRNLVILGLGLTILSSSTALWTHGEGPVHGQSHVSGMQHTTTNTPAPVSIASSISAAIPNLGLGTDNLVDTVTTLKNSLPILEGTMQTTTEIVTETATATETETEKERERETERVMTAVEPVDSTATMTVEEIKAAFTPEAIPAPDLFDILLD